MVATQKLKFWCQMVLQIALGLLLLQTASASAMDQKRGIVNVGSIIALDTIIGKVAKTAIELAVEDINASPDVLNTTLLNIDIRDSTQDAVQGASAAIELIRKECVAIVGPQTSVVADFVAYLADAAQVPIVTFAATNPSLSMHRFPYFIRITHSDSWQMKAIAELIPHYGWREVVVVYVDDDFGTGAIPALNDALKAVEAKVVYRAAIPVQANASDMRKVLKDQLFKLKSRVFIVHMHPDSGAVLFSQAKDLGMMSSEYVWIITEGIASQLESLNSTSLMSMQGVLGIKTHIPESNPKLEDFTPRWKETFKAENPTMQNPNWTVYGLFAYDTVWAIAYAIDRLQVGGGFKNNFTVPIAKQTKGQSLDMKVFQGGDELRREILDTNFPGLSGPVRISKNGERFNSSYDIVNVVGSKGYNVVGSWTKRKALQIHKEAYVVWPGGLTKVPRGWLIPPPGEKLKIAVPWEKGFTQFLSVKQQNGNQTYNITGFCVDVFEAVLSKLDYELPYELVPYGSGNVTAGYYDELVHQVYLKKFDAVVGDVAVIANRSKYVDFTQPYTETGLVMIVRIQQGGSSDPWAFLRPFTPAMWITTLAFFFFTGAVVWLLEHRRNRHFRGKPRKQILTFLWFSFSTLFSTQRERVISSLGRAVLLIWMFVVLVLVSSYTASLSSMLTVKQIMPEVQSLESLINQKLPIGYRQGSFIGRYLERELSVNKNLLRPFSSVQEYASALNRGPNHEGVAAIFDEETVTQNLFLSTGCKTYTKVGPTFRTGGYAFVFPKGSPLVSDISKAVLNLSESKEMQTIRTRWFTTNESRCNSNAMESSRVESARLSLDNFWGILMLTGSVSLFTVLYYLCRLCYRFVRGGHHSSSHNSSISRRFKTFANYADKKEIPQNKRKRSETEVENPFAVSPYGAPAWTSGHYDITHP